VAQLKSLSPKHSQILITISNYGMPSKLNFPKGCLPSFYGVRESESCLLAAALIVALRRSEKKGKAERKTNFASLHFSGLCSVVCKVS